MMMKKNITDENIPSNTPPAITNTEKNNALINELLTNTDKLRRTLHGNFRDELVEALYNDAQTIANRAVKQNKNHSNKWDWDQKIDKLVTSPTVGLPLMLGVLAIVFWITIIGANYPSQLLAVGLFWIEDTASSLFTQWHIPDWITGLLWHGIYRALAWVVAVMLPPMMIFFPLFTILEDLGYLPRIAFNLDRLFNKAGAHGKQVLTMSMGFGCNAAGIIACRTIDSPRERLIAILTNNFVPCNGRWPTLIVLASIFIGAVVPPSMASIAATVTIVMVVIIGVIFTLIVSAILSRTVLKGEASAFTLELPPYRRPSIVRILYTSIINRTIFVLWRAILMAAPAGAAIWLLANINYNNIPLATYCVNILQPLGNLIGLDGVILLAYVIAIPANEIVFPTILMLYLGKTIMTKEPSTIQDWSSLLVDEKGWTLLTAINLMLFSLLHNPCATTIYTMWKETRKLKWTLLGVFLPLTIAFIVTFTITQLTHIISALIK